MPEPTPITEEAQKNQTGRHVRYVNGWQYAGRVVKALGLLGVGTAAFGLAIFTAVVAITFTGLLLSGADHGHLLEGAKWVLLFALVSVVFMRYGYNALRSVQKAERMALLTRGNASNIPPEENLVRASSGPHNEDADGLLRPVSSLSTADESILLRPDASQPTTNTYALNFENTESDVANNPLLRLTQ